VIYFLDTSALADSLAGDPGDRYEIVMTNPPATIPRTAISANQHGPTRTPTAAGARTITKSYLTATKPASTFSGSATKVWKNPTISPIPMFSPRKLSKTSKPPSNNSAKSPRRRWWLLELAEIRNGDVLGRIEFATLS
jgi:hypothetical protein